MARPKKIGLDYFPVDVKFDRKIEAVESLYGNDGIVWILKFWQEAYQTEFGEVSFNGLFAELFANKCRITIELHNNIIRSSIEIGLIKETAPNTYTSNGIKKRISAVSHERKEAIKRKNKKNNILKESKVKETPHCSPNYFSFEDYKTKELTAYGELVKNQKWIDEQQKYNPNLNILLSLEKAHIQYWSTEAGWKKKRRSKEINWTSTYQNALSMDCNKVWKTKEEQHTGKTIEQLYGK